jgi:hypothetical protein
MSNDQTIDFAKIEGPVYTGRSRGEALRKLLGIDNWNNEDLRVKVLIPEETYSISSSFFLGLFGPSVVKAGSAESFYEQYSFEASDFLKTIIDGHVLRALQERNLFK